MSPQLSRTYTTVSCDSKDDDELLSLCQMTDDYHDDDDDNNDDNNDLEMSLPQQKQKQHAHNNNNNNNNNNKAAFLELLVCLTFFVVTNVVPKSWVGLDLEPYQRPIPHYRDNDSDNINDDINSDNINDSDYSTTTTTTTTTTTFTRNLVNNETFVTDTVPFELLILLAGVLPLVLQLVLSSATAAGTDDDCSSRKSRTRPQLLHATACVYFLSWSLNMLAVDLIKNYVGYLRPVFYQYCQPNADYSQCLAAQQGGSGIRRSFPSGHAATAFCGLTLLWRYLHGRFGVGGMVRRRNNNNRGGGGGGVGVGNYKDHQNGHQKDHCRCCCCCCCCCGTDDTPSNNMAWARLVSVLSFAIPMAVALWIAASRVRDNKHFPADIIAGALIGSGIASFTHGLWFE